jgi:hypothetical protein
MTGTLTGRSPSFVPRRVGVGFDDQIALTNHVDPPLGFVASAFHEFYAIVAPASTWFNICAGEDLPSTL